MLDLPMHTDRWPVFGRLGPSTRAGLIVLAAALTPCLVAAAEDRTGEQIYKQQCASCHGAAGQGTDENYPRPLAGDRSVAQLARFIARTMPEDDPGTVVGEEAERVAAYIYEAFYSRTAQ